MFELRDCSDCVGNPAADQYLPVLGLGAEPGREVAYGPNRRVARAVRKADLTERRETLCDANAKTEFAAMPTPVCDQLSRRLAHRHRHPDGTLGRVGDRY